MCATAASLHCLADAGASGGKGQDANNSLQNSEMSDFLSSDTSNDFRKLWRSHSMIIESIFVSLDTDSLGKPHTSYSHVIEC